MASVHDVAAFILAELGKAGALKLQELVFYAQAWSLVWDEQPLFPERIEAGDKGPVIDALYRENQNHPSIKRQRIGDASKLTDDQRATIAAVLAFYGPYSAEWLSALTRRETPWLAARKAACDGCATEISTAALREFYATYPATKRQIPVSVARGLDLVVTLPKDLVPDVIYGEPTEIVGLEAWLETGERNPWSTKTGG